MADTLPKRPVLWARSTKQGPHTVEVEGAPEMDGESIPRRHPTAKSRLREEPEPGVATVFDILKRSARKFGSANAIGSRKVVDTIAETKQIKDQSGKTADKKWTYYQLSDYNYFSFIELERRALKTGSALRKLGLNKSDRIEVYAATSPFWFSVAHGASSQSITIATAYDTLGGEGLSHSLVQAKAKAIFLDPTLIPRVTKALDKAKDVKTVVYNEDAPQKVEQKDIEGLKQKHPDVEVYSFQQFQHLAAEAVEPVPPTAEDLMCIMYTSGSTGAPKGVLLKHKNIVAAITGVNAVIEEYMAPGERLLAYLPLAHIIEFVFENAALYWGGVLGYGNPRTLTDQSVRKCEGDIRAFKPSIMVGVPAVWESVKKGILSKVGPPNSFKTKVFWGAMAAKENLLYWGLPGAQLLDALILNKIKEATGGNLRLVMNGGGPIAGSTLKFVSFAICPMINGYGLTETAGMGALNDPAAWTPDALGVVPAAVEVKLVDVPDLNYFSSHDPPRGEVWIRGGAVIEGYLDNPEENAKAFQDGWFKTGDIGEFDATGQLKVIDRKKNLVKTLNGEYIALEKVNLLRYAILLPAPQDTNAKPASQLESLYRSTPVVANVCVYASSDHTKPIAIISAAEPALRKVAEAAGVNSSASLSELSSNEQVRAAVRKEMQSAGKKAGLQGIELIQGVIITDEEWTPQNGLVTNAMKLNRTAVVETFKAQIEKVYKSSGGS
ncbi:hypothetical protein B0A49_12373 [Cryomyces minteri]|uniref:AMP-dependent synthetase/ligase domain-containing protein n=1 Tax=Cryomyces minteri TaxID=331657 RepID=A0A4V5NDQ1_9PEZI|nr:hypothetical protein B0A49_12373 [Cryomyces minteri]